MVNDAYPLLNGFFLVLFALFPGLPMTLALFFLVLVLGFPDTLCLLACCTCSVSFVSALASWIAPLVAWSLRTQPSPPAPSRHSFRHIRRLNRLHLRHALLIVDSLPNMTSGLRSYPAIVSSHGSKPHILNTAKLPGPTLDAVRHNVLVSQHLQPLDLPFLQSFPILMDTGASCCTSPSLDDFEADTLKDLPSPQTMHGIGGNLEIRQLGILHFKTLDDDGSPYTIRCPGFYTPTLATRLFSPQVFLATGGKGGTYVVKEDKCLFRLPNGRTLTMPSIRPPSCSMLTAFSTSKSKLTP